MDDDSWWSANTDVTHLQVSAGTRAEQEIVAGGGWVVVLLLCAWATITTDKTAKVTLLAHISLSL
jgi:hypothetical protein